MNNNTVKVILAVFIVLALIYFFAASNKPTDTTTIVTTQATTKYTTRATSATTMPGALPECLIMTTECKQDRCYYGNAINRKEISLCEQIKSPRLLTDCVNKASKNDELENTILEGQIFNTRDCGVYPGLTVEIVDLYTGDTVNSMETDSNGEYWFEVTPGLEYGVYVTLENTILAQNTTKTTTKQYIMDFGLS